MPVSSIGGANFIELNCNDRPGCPPPLVRQETSLFTTPGVDGCAVRLDGVKGKPFQMRSCAIANNAAAAWSGFLGYSQMVGLGPLALVFEGKDMGDLGTDYVVLDVDDFEVHRVFGLVHDGTVYGDRFLGWATWTLQPVEAV